MTFSIFCFSLELTFPVALQTRQKDKDITSTTLCPRSFFNLDFIYKYEKSIFILFYKFKPVLFLYN